MSQCFFNAPPVIIDPLQNRSASDADNLCPFSDSFRLMPENKTAITAGISSLLFTGSPTAVVGFIVSIVIDTIKRILAGWTWPHISQKILKAVPSTANSYSSPSISRELRTDFATATIEHQTPNSVLFRSRFAMGQTSHAHPFLGVAATTAGPSIDQALRSVNAVFTTIAHTMPHHPSTFRTLRGNAQCDKSSEALSANIHYLSLLHRRFEDKRLTT